MTPDELNAIEARAEAATKGPWREGSVETFHVFAPCDDCMGPERVLLRMNDRAAWPVPFAVDATFIAHAREDIPQLLAEVRKLTAERDAYRRQWAALVCEGGNIGLERAAAWHEERAKQYEARAADVAHMAIASGAWRGNAVQDRRDAAALRALKETA